MNEHTQPSAVEKAEQAENEKLCAANGHRPHTWPAGVTICGRCGTDLTIDDAYDRFIRSQPKPTPPSGVCNAAAVPAPQPTPAPTSVEDAAEEIADAVSAGIGHLARDLGAIMNTPNVKRKVYTHSLGVISRVCQAAVEAYEKELERIVEAEGTPFTKEAWRNKALNVAREVLRLRVELEKAEALLKAVNEAHEVAFPQHE